MIKSRLQVYLPFAQPFLKAYPVGKVLDVGCGRQGFDANLGCGTYSVAVAIHTADTHIANNYEWRDLALVFNVVSLDKATFVGVTWLPPTWTITQ